MPPRDRPLFYDLDENLNPVPRQNWTLRAMYPREQWNMLTSVGNVEVSTVFLGHDHNYSPTGRPVLFETMIFGGQYNEEQERYCTAGEASEGHARWIEKVRSSQQRRRRRVVAEPLPEGTVLPDGDDDW